MRPWLLFARPRPSTLEHTLGVPCPRRRPMPPGRPARSRRPPGGGSRRTRRRGSAWNWARRSPCSHRGWRCSPWAMVPAVGPAAPRVPAIRLPTATTTRWRRRWPRPAPARWPRWTRPPTMTCSLPAGPPGRSWPARRARTISAPRWPTRRHRSRSATSSPPGGGHTRGMDTHLVAVVGATATGKSGLGIALARALGGEVVNADSMQLYQGMDIGTAKEPAAARQGVPHHLLDVWPVTQTANVADYQKLARTAIEDIAARGRIPVLVGGSGLYVRAALDDLDFPGTDDGIRARLETELARLGAAALHARLATLDPAAAGAILPGNGRRIVRALEVIELSGRPFSATMPSYEQVRPAVQIGLTLPRPELDARIAARVDRMWQAGLDAEVRSLVRKGLRGGKTASRALGYQQLLRYLDRESTLEAAHAETVKATKRFARRQESWFRRDPRVHWLNAATPAEHLITDALRHLHDHEDFTVS